MTNKEKTENKPLASQRKSTIETKGPAKNKNPRVLHKDGSFADLPDKGRQRAAALWTAW